MEFKCPLCGEWIPIRQTRGGKPHAFCRECGFEMFLRMEPAIKALEIALKSKSGLVRKSEQGDSD